jgi:hypothetical protein
LYSELINVLKEKKPTKKRFFFAGAGFGESDKIQQGKTQKPERKFKSRLFAS